MNKQPNRFVALSIKRLFDLCVAGSILTVLSPLIVAVYLVILIRLGQPVIFRQKRPGYRGRPFYVLKFRTMMRASHRDGKPLSDGERIGRLGKLLRKTSLDELPQLWNVLKGDMSLIGPRPLLMSYVEKYTPEQMRRHDMHPGITGWAQVNGRQDIPFSKRLELDVWYVDHWSLWLDLKIFVLTIKRVMGTSGVRSGQDVQDVDDLGLNARPGKEEASRDTH